MGTYPISVGTHPLEKVREICRTHANGNSDKSAQHSDGWLRDIISKAVVEEKRKNLPPETYPPISGGEHDFVATVEPTDLNGFPVVLKLIVVKDTQHGGDWAVTTILTEETYKSRITSRKMSEGYEKFNEGSLGALSDVTEKLGSSVMRMLAENKTIIVALSPTGSFDRAKGFDEKEDAVMYLNDLLADGYHHSAVKIFSVVKPKIEVTF